MGNTFRKLFHTEPDPERNVSLPGIGCLFEDPRSPTQGINRTPIILDKKPYLETDIDALTPPRHPRVNLLKKQLDPRSPSSTIDRTPIMMLDSDAESNVFDSPESLYSRFEGDVDSTLYLPSPPEPSVLVSDFEPEEDEELHSLIEQLRKSDLESNSPIKEYPPTPEIIPERKQPVSSETNKTKQLYADLVTEIIESYKEYQETVDQGEHTPKIKKPSKKQPPSFRDENSKYVKSVKKVRPPLSNITSSAGNTPSKLVLRKGDNIIKVSQTGENSPLTPVGTKHSRVQWDNDTTVII